MACSERIAYLKLRVLNKIQIFATDMVTVNGLRNIHWQMSICCLFDRAVFYWCTSNYWPMVGDMPTNPLQVMPNLQCALHSLTDQQRTASYISEVSHSIPCTEVYSTVLRIIVDLHKWPEVRLVVFYESFVAAIKTDVVKIAGFEDFRGNAIRTSCLSYFEGGLDFSELVESEGLIVDV